MGEEKKGEYREFEVQASYHVFVNIRFTLIEYMQYTQIKREVSISWSTSCTRTAECYFSIDDGGKSPLNARVSTPVSAPDPPPPRRQRAGKEATGVAPCVYTV